jgi:glycosyltransferase involved in cell wall biosynthesis
MQRYLKLFLEKLPEQTLFDRLEVVLDHNEPTPEEMEWVAGFMQKYPGRLRHIVTSPVQPIGVSMNTCIKHAQGKYLAIWNVDDLRTPRSLESQMEALEAAPGAAIAHGTYKIVPAFGAHEGETVDNSGLPLEEHRRGMTVGPFFMFPAALCQKAGMFDEQLRSGADFDFTLRLLQQGPPVFAKDALGYYLNEGQGASTRPNSLQPLEAAVIYLRYGIWDKLAPERLPDIMMKYDVANLCIEGEHRPVAAYFSDYREEMQRRRAAYFPILSRRYSFERRCWRASLARLHPLNIARRVKKGLFS